MIKFENGLLEKIQEAVYDFADETDQYDFTLTVKITVDDGIVDMPIIVKD